MAGHSGPNNGKVSVGVRLVRDAGPHYCRLSWKDQQAQYLAGQSGQATSRHTVRSATGSKWEIKPPDTASALERRIISQQSAPRQPHLVRSTVANVQGKQGRVAEIGQQRKFIPNHMWQEVHQHGRKYLFNEELNICSETGE